MMRLTNRLHGAALLDEIRRSRPLGPVDGVDLGDVAVHAGLLLRCGLVLFLGAVGEVQAGHAPADDAQADNDAGLGGEVLVGSVGRCQGLDSCIARDVRLFEVKSDWRMESRSYGPWSRAFSYLSMLRVALRSCVPVKGAFVAGADDFDSKCSLKARVEGVCWSDGNVRR